MSSAAHAHSIANSSASVAEEFEWIHCNACYCDLWTASANANSSDHHHHDAHSTATASTTAGLARFAVAQCTHVLCASCLSQASNPAAPGLIQCPVCHQVVHFSPLSSPDGSTFNPDMAQYFSPLLPQWSQLLSTAEFRQRNIDSLIRFLKDKLHLQRQGIERAVKELKSMRHLQSQYQAVVEENQALRMQLESYIQRAQQQQHHHHHSRPSAPPPPTHAPPPPSSRLHSTASFQRSKTQTALPISLSRPPSTSATRASTHLSHPTTSHSRAHSRAPSVRPAPAPPTNGTRSRTTAAGRDRFSLSRATTASHITPTRPRAPASPSGGTVVSYSSGARMGGTGQAERTDYLKRSASTMTAANTGAGGGAGGSRGVRELRSQFRGR